MTKTLKAPILLDERSQKARVDRDKHTVYGVKAASMKSRNGWSFTEECLKDAARHYATSIDIEHVRGSGNPSVYSRFAKAINPRFEHRSHDEGGSGIYVDVKYLGSHDLADSFTEAASDAEMDDMFGLSHEIDDYDINKAGVVTKIRGIRRLALVSTPACTNGLFDDLNPEIKMENEIQTPSPEALELAHLKAKDQVLVLLDEQKAPINAVLVDSLAYVPADKRMAFLEFLNGVMSKPGKREHAPVIIDEEGARGDVPKPFDHAKAFALVSGR